MAAVLWKLIVHLHENELIDGKFAFELLSALDREARETEASLKRFIENVNLTLNKGDKPCPQKTCVK